VIETQRDTKARHAGAGEDDWGTADDDGATDMRGSWTRGHDCKPDLIRAGQHLQNCQCYNFDVAMPAGDARPPRRTSRAFLDDATAFPPPLIDATGVIGCKPDWISMVALQ
jgi:hypothetical protein